jgi:hypothetical protein
MATTTNFGWETPDDTDLVKDGALAMRTLGNAIDTSLVDLKGGTTGQVLSKTSNTDMDFTWINNDIGDITSVVAGVGMTGGGTTGAVTLTNDMASTITASGDIIVGTGSGSYDNLAIGTTGQVLTADTTVSPYKVKWATAGGGDFIKVASGSFSAASSITIDSCFTSTYKRYVAYMTLGPSAHDNTRIQLRYGSNTESGNYYGSAFLYTRANALTTYGANPTNGNMSITSSCGAAFVTINFTNVGTGGSAEALFFGSGQGSNSQQVFSFAGKADTSRNYDGFVISAASGNFTGTYTIYGLKD